MLQVKKHTLSYYGKTPDQWPTIVYAYPDCYDELSLVDKADKVILDSFICSITYLEHTALFVRCAMSQKVIGQVPNLDYEIWIALSDKYFEDYKNNYLNEEHETKYSGSIGNNFLPYQDSKGIPVTVFVNKGNQRPTFTPNINYDHQFTRDFYRGITKLEAEDRIKEILRINNEADSRSVQKKSWWKLG